MYTNTAWMLDGASCWILIDENYVKGYIQKLQNQRTTAKIMLSDNQILDVPVNQLLRASNSKTNDLTELPHINEPEILFKIKNNVYLDRQVILKNPNTSLADFVQYRKYIDERLIMSQIPPHIFSTLFYAYNCLDMGKNSQIFITGNRGSGKTLIINDFVSFLNKEIIPYYNLIKSFITDNEGHTQGVINYRFIFKQKKIIGFLIQFYYINSSNFNNSQFFQQKWEDIQNNEILNLLKSQTVQNENEFVQLFEKIILIINGMVQLSENIQMISILEYPGRSDEFSTYISEKIEQIYIQYHFKNCKQQLIQDQLEELYKQINFEDNLDILENLEQTIEIPLNILKLGNIASKDTQLLFIRCIMNRTDLQKYHILDSIKFFKTSYPHRMTFNEFYQRFHHLDTFNRKITLQKHLNSNQDMKALVTEICKRLTNSKGQLFGQTQIYFKKEAIENFNKLLCTHNLKLSAFAKIIQRAYRVRQFKKIILACVKRIALNKTTTIVEKESELQQQKSLNEIDNQQQQQQQQLETQQKEIVIEISDQESYSLLDQEQLAQYQNIKKQQILEKQQCLITGKIYEEKLDIAFSLLTESQIQQRNLNIKKQQTQQLLKELELIKNDVSDEESFSFLTQEQKFQYLIMKKQNQVQVAFRLLDQNQQHQIKQQKRLNKIKDFQQKFYDQLEPFLSDFEAFKQLTIRQQQEYKLRKINDQRNVALSLLTEQQHLQRRKLIISQKPRQKLKKQFLVDDDFSDFESFNLLEEVQQEKYKLEKKEFKPLKLLQNQTRFGYLMDISEAESFQLLLNKEEYLRYKEKLNQCKDISDQEAYLALENIDKYKKLKSEGQTDVAKSLADSQKLEYFERLRLQAQTRLDELGVIRHDLLDSLAFQLLNEGEWQLRKTQLQEELITIEKMHSIGNYSFGFNSFAFQSLTSEKKEERKQKERSKALYKSILNPILFENYLHPFSSVAFRLLKNKDLVYQNYSLSYSLLKDKQTRNQQLKDLTIYHWEEYKNISEKRALQQEKIYRYEQDKIAQNKEEFSDYEAFKLLDEDQVLDYKQNAYQLLDEEQKIIHRRNYRQKLISNEFHSDLESFELLSEDSKKKYQELKITDVSDYCAFEILEDKEEYYREKQKKKDYLQKISEKGLKIYFGSSPIVLTTEQYEIMMKKKQDLHQTIKLEEENLLLQIQQQQAQQQKRQETKKVFIVCKLIQNPKQQPYIIYENCQLNKKILDIRSAPDKNQGFFFNNEFAINLEKNKFIDYCQSVLNHEGKQVQKIMKCQNDNLKHTLTKLSSEAVALNVFRSITKFAHMKRSKLNTKQHLERILCALIGSTAHIELPPAPKSLIRGQAIDFDALKKSIQLETAGRKYSGQEDFECNQEFKEEILLQLFKQIEGNKKEHIYYVLRLCIVVTHCVQFYNPIPYIQFLVEKIESPDNKLFKDPDIYKYSKQLIKNLAVNTDEIVFKNEVKIPLCPRVYLPSSEEIHLMFECKMPVVNLLLHSETPIWVEIDHHFSVKQVIKNACNYIGLQNNWNYFGLMVVQQKGDQIYNSSWIDESANFFDVLNKLEFHEQINNNVYKLNKKFQIYLSIKEYFSFNAQDLDILDLVFYQMIFEIKRNKISLKSEELQILNEIELYVKYEDDSVGNSKYNLSDKNAAKLEYLKILRLSDGSNLPEIIY